jgi:GT2 family glycosyltransferase
VGDLAGTDVAAAGSVSVVIPTWNGARHLERCLAALAAQTRPADEIVVVDNGSTDGTADWLRARFPAARLVVNDENRGFARATNQGILAARGETVVLLNNDTAPEPSGLAALVAPLAADAALGACAATLVFAHRPERVNAAGLTVGRDLVAFEEAFGRPASALPAAPWPVFGPSGGAAAFRRAALDDVGLFDERFFAYLEDVDLAWRLRLRGWRTVAVPAARVAHAYSATAGADSPFKRYHLARNRVWLLVKNVPGALWRRHAPAALWYDAAALLAAVASRDAAWLRGRRDGLLAARSLLPERRIIQRRRTASIDDLDALLGPRVGPLGVWRARRLAREVGSA